MLFKKLTFYEDFSYLPPHIIKELDKEILENKIKSINS